MRTRDIIGVCADEPKIGLPFFIMNDSPLDKSGGETMRMVNTSRVAMVRTVGSVTCFKTESGTDYMLETLED